MGTKQSFALLLVCLLLAGCNAANQGQNLTEIIDHEGEERTYHIFLPSDFSSGEPSPLVIVLHGGGGEGSKFDRGTAGTLTAAAEERGAVLVFPDGIERQWCDGRTEHLVPDRECNDVSFIAAIIDAMVQDYGIDPARVYATGISNGGFMSIRLAMELSDKIAAVAPVTAQLAVALENETPQRPISVMIINGTDDPLVPYDGGHVRIFSFGRSRGEILSTADTVEHFRQHNNCDATPETVALPDGDQEDGTAVEIERYTGCEAGTEVMLVKVIGGGHTWPGGAQYLGSDLVGAVSREINASEMILDFFLEKSR